VFFLAEKPKGPPFGTSLRRCSSFFRILCLADVPGRSHHHSVFAGQEFWMVWQRLPGEASGGSCDSLVSLLTVFVFYDFDDNNS
jgi:hypothetical protein